MDEISELPMHAIEQHPDLQFAANNDIGLCISRMEAAYGLTPSTEGVSPTAAYVSIRENEPLISEMMQSMASGIATRLSGTLYDLRQTLPLQAKELAEQVLAKLPKEATEDLPPLQYFSWGKLGTPAYREAAMLFAQDRLKCFLRGTVASFDTDKICRVLPYGEFQKVAPADTVSPLLVEALTKADPEAKDQSFVIGLITSKPAFMKWATDIREKLRNSPVGQAVVSVTETIDAISDQLQKIDAEMLSTLGADANVTSMSLLTNMETVLANIQLMRAAMLHYKENTLVGRLLLTPQVIQNDTFEAFSKEGGNEEMIRTYVAHLRLNQHIQFQSNGILADTISSIYPKALISVTENADKLRNMTTARRARALQESLVACLDTHYRESLASAPPNARSTRHIHEQARNRALIGLRSKKPIETISVEYLVALRSDPLIDKLYTPMNNELISVAKTESTITRAHITQANCRAVLSYLIDELSTRFSPRAAA